MDQMRAFELRISLKDWIFILALAIGFAGLNSTIIYLLTYNDIFTGLKVGLVLGLVLGISSFGLVHFNNSYLLVRIQNPILWWIFSAIASFLAGFIGFLLSFWLVSILGLLIPVNVKNHLIIVSILIGILNYLTGLVIFLFVRMGKRKEEIEKFLLTTQIQTTTKVLESHFLVNVLNNIIELIHKDPLKAEDYLVNLTKFLRKILKLEAIITLEEELELIQSYIYLENLRRGGKIYFLKDIEMNLLKKVLIPKLSIQVLIENAIYHGFDGENPLIIEFFAQNRNGRLLFFIRNSGLPIKTFEKKIGLYTLEKRLKLFGGNLKLISKNPVTFAIELPIEKTYSYGGF